MWTRILSYKYIVLAGLAIVAMSAYIIIININKVSTSNPTYKQVRADISGYKFINPLLFSDTEKDETLIPAGLMTQLQDYIDSSKKNSKISSVSIYFRDMNTGRWTGINEDETYYPASMLKVIIAMAVLKLAEENPDILSRKLFYKNNSVGQTYKPDDHLNDGYYRVDRLLEFMIKASDNGATDALISDPDINKSILRSYSIFRLPPITNSLLGSDFMSAKSYSAVFRTLYNSTFFQWGLSEQLLTVLSQTSFTKGLLAGLPAGIQVSHKFGEYKHTGDGPLNELHDCGIIYYPTRPYFLCVMTKGPDFPILEKTISDLSGMIYHFVDKAYTY
jgi:beta-lactamase class A